MMAEPISTGAAVVGAVAGGVSALTDVIESIMEASARKLILKMTNFTQKATLSHPL